MRLLLNCGWLSNENVFTIPKLCIFYATVLKLALAPKGANVLYPLSCKITSSTRPQTVLILKEMWQYLHLCSKATSECFNQINGFIFSFRFWMSRQFLPDWETCSFFTFQSEQSTFSKHPSRDSACFSLENKMLKVSLGFQCLFIMQTESSKNRCGVSVSPCFLLRW